MTEAVELLNISLTDIEFGNRARKEYGDLTELIKSFKDKGVIQPLAVMRVQEGKRPFKLLAGGRRMTAALQAKLPSVPCRIFQEGIDELEYREIELMENASREDLTWNERAWLTDEIDRLWKLKHGEAKGPSEGHSSSDTAKLLNTSPATVSREKTLVEGIKKYGDKLLGAKNQSEAIRMLKKFDRQEKEAEVVEKYKKEVDNNEANVKFVMGNSYILGDFFENVKSVPDRTYHLVEIDPPYGIDLKKIKRTPEQGQIQSYNEIDAKEYPDFLTQLMTEVERVMFPRSWVLCWCSFQWMPHVIKAMREVGIETSPTPGIWYKGSQGQTNNPEIRLGSSCEPFIYGRKGEAVLYQPGRSNGFHFRPVFQDYKVHPTERPIEMIEDILKTFGAPEGRVMVPFLGSGNTLLAAANLSRGGVGFDLSEEYRNAYIGRVDEGQPGEYKSYI